MRIQLLRIELLQIAVPPPQSLLRQWLRQWLWLCGCRPQLRLRRCCSFVRGCRADLRCCPDLRRCSCLRLRCRQGRLRLRQRLQQLLQEALRSVRWLRPQALPLVLQQRLQQLRRCCS
jgi:hypothetical protein